MSDSIRVSVVDCSYGVEMPNVFTPNGDGSNDLFRPVTLQGVSSISFRIYNRWGQELFQTNQLEAGWDGRTPSGRPVPAGTYFWVLETTAIKAPDSTTTNHGTVTLLR